MVETVCPAELANAPAERPEPGEGAVIRYNPAGGAHLAAVIAWGVGLYDILLDARAQCPVTSPAANPAPVGR